LSIENLEHQLLKLAHSVVGLDLHGSKSISETCRGRKVLK